jgi:hypothetical protein
MNRIYGAIDELLKFPLHVQTSPIRVEPFLTTDNRKKIEAKYQNRCLFSFDDKSDASTWIWIVHIYPQ